MFGNNPFKKISQNNLYFKIITKLIFYYHIIKTLVDDYGFRFKVKTVIVDYDFFKKKLKPTMVLVI